MLEIVAICVSAGAPPAKIYATIKTGRMLTTENMKLLSKADIKNGKMPVMSTKDWQAGPDSRARR